MNNLEFLQAYDDWKAQNQWPDTSAERFVQTLEDQRLVRNASATLKYLEDTEGQSGEEVTNTVWYLLNAEVGNPEIEEWLSDAKPTGQEWVAASGLDPAVIAAATTGQEWTPEDDDDADTPDSFYDDEY